MTTIMRLNPIAAWRAWQQRRAVDAERRLFWSALTLPPGTYVQAPDGTWQPADHIDPSRPSVRVQRRDDQPV
jgi:hypothetical protein